MALFKLPNKIRGKCENQTVFGGRWVGLIKQRFFMSPSQDIWYQVWLLYLTPYFMIGFHSDTLRGPGANRWKS